MTLFFFQVFLTFTNNGDDVFGHSLTNGPNGILNVDELSFFGWSLPTTTSQGQFAIAYLYAAVVLFGLVYVALRLLNDSRTGRAWRSLREDPLAAELMSMPVNRLKLMAFAFGAAVAGLTGGLFAAEQGAVFPVNFDATLLITVYAMVILGGVGSVTGVALGAVVNNASLEALRTPEAAAVGAFGALVVAVALVVRPLWRAAAVLAGTIVFGLVVHTVVDAAWERGSAGAAVGDTWIDRAVDGWALLPSDPGDLSRYGYLALVASVLGITLLHGWWRTLALVPVLYLTASVWETVMLPQPAVSRYLLIGAMLVGLMAARPQGLMGTARVEIA